MKTDNVVTIYQNQAFTTSLTISDQCKVSHKSAIALIRKYSEGFKELNKGKLSFSSDSPESDSRLKSESVRQGGGQKTVFAILNEDQAAFLVLLFRNNPITFKFKLVLLKEFRNALNEINRLYHEPERTIALKDKRAAHNPMMDAIKELRADHDKEMRDDIYWTENKLCNFIVVHRFIGVCKIGGEDGLTNYEVEFLAQVRKRNEAYILAGLDYKTRKEKLIDFGKKYRQKYLDPSPRKPLLEVV